MRSITAFLLAAVALLGGFYSGFHYELARVTAAGTPTAAAVANITGATTGNPRGGAAGGTGTAPGTGATTGGGGGTAGAGGFGRGTTGTVVSLVGDVLTITDAGGATVKVQLNSNTSVNKVSKGTIADLAAGTTVTVQGQRGADGTVTATAITVTPARAG